MCITAVAKTKVKPKRKGIEPHAHDRRYITTLFTCRTNHRYSGINESDDFYYENHLCGPTSNDIPKSAITMFAEFFFPFNL